jgi:hypothetical protein
MADYTNRFDEWMAEKFRPFAKGWLDMVRNLFIVALLTYTADKSDNFALKLFAFITYLIFVVSVLSYIVEQMPASWSTAKRPWVRRAVDAVFILLGGLLYWQWANYLMRLIDVVVKTQFAK